MHLAAAHARPVRASAHRDEDTEPEPARPVLHAVGRASDERLHRRHCKPAVPIKIYVDGNVNVGDPTQIELSNLREIAIVIGTPPATIPMEFPR